MKSSKLLVPGIGALIVFLGGYVGYTYFSNSNTIVTTSQPSNDTTQAPVTLPVATKPTPAPKPTPTPAPVAITSKYKDGTYSATGTYRTPESIESINVTLTLANDVVTNVTSTISASASDSARYQNRFLSNYKQLVIGKKIDSLNLSQVSGSSLTSGGFNSAISQIKSQALS